MSESGGEPAGEAWEDPDCVRRTVVLPADLAEALARRAAHRGLSVSDLLAEYAADGLRRDQGQELPVYQSGPGRHRTRPYRLNTTPPDCSAVRHSS
jgi:hypothetical protein